MFGDAAGYNRFMGRWSQLAAPVSIDFARPSDSGSILDLGCETGSLSFAIAAVRPNCRIIGIDRSARVCLFCSEPSPSERRSISNS
jgi:methylase of polypeptide subunit release factors